MASVKESPGPRVKMPPTKGVRWEGGGRVSKEGWSSGRGVRTYGGRSATARSHRFRTNIDTMARAVIARESDTALIALCTGDCAWSAMAKETYPDTIMELDTTDLDGLENGGNRLPIRLRIKRSPCRRILGRDEVRHVRCGTVDQRGHSESRVPLLVYDSVRDSEEPGGSTGSKV